MDYPEPPFLAVSAPLPLAAVPDQSSLEGRRILIVEDDDVIADVVSQFLAHSGLVVERASDGISAVTSAREKRPDLIVLDWMLPGIIGPEVLRRLRPEVDSPVVMLSALGAEANRITGLELGADDYITKPFSPRELVLRVHAVLRRSLAEFAPEPQVSAGPFALDSASRTALHDGTPLELTAREFDLLKFMLHHPDQVFSRNELLAAVWGWEFGDLSTVTVHMRRLRRKIERDPSHPQFIITVWGVGYRFDTSSFSNMRDGEGVGSDSRPRSARGKPDRGLSAEGRWASVLNYARSNIPAPMKLDDDAPGGTAKIAEPT